MRRKLLFLYVPVLILLGCLPAFSADPEEVITQVCVLESVEGLKLITDCDGEPYEFIMGEEIKITDLAGRPIKIWEIKLPADVEITHKCLADDMCQYAIELILQKRMPPQPQ